MQRPTLVDVLSESVAQRDGGGSWMRDSLAAVAAAPGFDSVASRYSAAARMLKHASSSVSAEHAAALDALGAAALAAHGTVCMFRSLLLLVACKDLTDDARADLVDRVFRSGDNDERVALLCTLVHLPSPERYLATAVEACRSNVRDVFVAIACDNDYPTRHFPDAAFNQMVMKALFSNIELARVRGLGSRLNPDLRRMALDYAAERRAAGREVPFDIALAMGEARSA